MRPASKLGWWVFWLGLAACLWGLILPFATQRIATALRNADIESRIPLPIGFNGVMLALLLAIAPVVLGVRALRRGERSGLTIIGLVLAVLIGGFWILFALGEVLLPH